MDAFFCGGISVIICCFAYFSHGYFSATRAFDEGGWLSVSFVPDTADLPYIGPLSAGTIELIMH